LISVASEGTDSSCRIIRGLSAIQLKGIVVSSPEETSLFLKSMLEMPVADRARPRWTLTQSESEKSKMCGLSLAVRAYERIGAGRYLVPDLEADTYLVTRDPRSDPLLVLKITPEEVQKRKNEPYISVHELCGQWLNNADELLMALFEAVGSRLLS
jgi:hypothetical protein